MEYFDDMLQVITGFNAAVSNIRMYTPNHPQVGRHLKRTYGQLQQIMKQRPEITLLIIDDDVVVDNHVLKSSTPHLSNFAAVMKQSSIERITINTEVTLEALRQIVSDLASTDQEIVHSAQGITIGKVKLISEEELKAQRDLLSPELKEKLSELERFRDISLDEIKDIYHQISTTKEISMGGVEQIVQGFLTGMLHNINPLQMLSSLKASDEYTFTHAVNVCILTLAQAESLGVEGEMLYDIGIAASMHDAGKMFVSNDVLNKPSKLDDKEWQHMQQHSENGAKYILKLEGIPKLAFLAALEHHIGYDGSGYPNMGAGWSPNIVSQMITIADIFDAMRSKRVYKDPLPDEEIIRILRQKSGTTVNPKLLENFLRLIKM